MCNKGVVVMPNCMLISQICWWGLVGNVYGYLTASHILIYARDKIKKSSKVRFDGCCFTTNLGDQ